MGPIPKCSSWFHHIASYYLSHGLIIWSPTRFHDNSNYPSHFIYNNPNNAYKKTFELRLLNISTAIKTTQYGISDQEVPQYLYQHFILIPMNLPTEIDASAPINISTDSEVQGEIDQLKRLLGKGKYSLVFKNAESQQLNILYKRADGNMGLMEPEI